MKLVLPAFLIITLAIINSVAAQEPSPSFAVNHSVANTNAFVSKMKCSISKGRVLLQWNIFNNREADQFEVESSLNGKKFQMTALVFATENQDTEDYFYYEKAKKKKIYYRLKIINKDKSFHYSDLITP